MWGLNGSRVVITGAGGFIGGALLRRLAPTAAEVCALVRSEAAAKALRQQFGGNGNVRTEVCDIRNAAAVRQALAGATSVFHAAALVNSAAPAADYHRTNVDGTRHMCEAALHAGVSRLVFVSTSDVFGLHPRAKTLSEDSAFQPWDEKYPDSKIEATRLVQQFRRDGLATTVVYPGWVYRTGDLQFIPSILAQLRSGSLPLWSSPEMRLNLVHIEDLVEGLLLAGNAPAAHNEEFLMLDSKSITLTAFCDALGAAMNVRFRTIRVPYRLAYALGGIAELAARWRLMSQPLITTAMVKSFGHQFVFDTSKADQRLGWRPRVDFASGLDDALRWERQRTDPPQNKER